MLRRRLDQAAREALDPRNVARQLVGQRVGVRVDPQAERGAESRDPGAEPIEWVGSRAHRAATVSPTDSATSAPARRRATSGLAALSA